MTESGFIVTAKSAACGPLRAVVMLRRLFVPVFLSRITKVALAPKLTVGGLKLRVETPLLNSTGFGSMTCSTINFEARKANLGSSPREPSRAEKRRVVPRPARLWGRDDVEPGRISSKICVPAAVPSENHTSRPLTPSSAVKQRTSPTTVISWMSASPRPVTMSLILTVPFAEPSLTQSSRPLTPLSARKKSLPFTLRSSVGSEPRFPAPPARVLMFLTSIVPLERPLLFQSSRPLTPSSATKYRFVPTTVRYAGRPASKAPLIPGTISFTTVVPVLVPSLFQSSRPVS